MKRSNRKALLSMLMGTGLYLLDPLRNRLADRLDHLSDRAQDTYETASDRLGRATRVIRGTDRRGLGTTAGVLIGMGLGVGIGLLFAPATGEETRRNLAAKVHDFGEGVRNRSHEATAANY